MDRRDARRLNLSVQEELRKAAVIAVEEEGLTQREASKIFGLSRAAITKWIPLYREGGIQALDTKPQGRPTGWARLQEKQAKEVQSLVINCCPEQLDLPYSLWTRDAIRQVIEEKFQIYYSRSSMGNFLRKWGFTSQKPSKKAIEQNPIKVSHWMKTKYPEIVKRAAKEKVEIHWGDEMGLRSDHQTGTTYGLKGKTPIVIKSAKLFSCSMISSISLQGTLRFMVYHGSFTAEVFLKFLQRQIRQANKKIFFILDNHPVHHAKKVQKWILKHQDKIEFFFLPPYSPQMNPDEMLNQDVKANVIRHKRPRNQKELKDFLRSYLRRIQKLPKKVQHYFEKKELEYISVAENAFLSTIYMPE